MSNEGFLGKFVVLARKFQGLSWMEVDPVERDETVAYILRLAGFEFHHLEMKPLLGNYRYQDGSSTGETYSINPHCPLTVIRTNQISFDLQKEENDYRATIWLDRTVNTVASIRDDEQATTRLASLIGDILPLMPIRLTCFGDMLIESPSLDGHVREDDVIWKRSVVHGNCMGYFDLHPCSKEWRTLVCRQCKLRVYVPANLTTFGDLRKDAQRMRMSEMPTE